MAIEYFVCGGRFLFNEMAPRPHNSGHYTIEGCSTSQYRELCRYLLGLPLEEPQLKAPAVMKTSSGKTSTRPSASPPSGIPTRSCTYTARASRVPSAKWDILHSSTAISNNTTRSGGTNS